MIEIPFKNSPWFSQEVTLGNTNYILEFYWNTRGNCWFMNISSRLSIPIIQGLKIVANYEILTQYSLSEIKGQFYVISYSNKKIDYDSFTNGDAHLVYVSEDENV